jgi:hypothetical protein
MKTKKTLGVLCLVLAMATATAACGRTEETAEIATPQNAVDTEKSLITLYYSQGEELFQEEEPYQLKQPDSISNSVDEVMTAQQMPEGISYTGFSVDEDNNLYLTVSVEREVSTEELLLNKAAIVSTMEQLQGVSSIQISFRSPDGTVLDDAEYNADSFYYYEEED